jgi:hypothetical protein
MRNNELDKYDQHYRMLARKFRAFAIIVVIVIALLATHTANQPDYACSEATIIVREGDTLWSIAETECTGEITQVADYLVDKYGTTIYAGQAIDLPIDDN